MPTAQACDRCHSLKARCLSGPEGSCYRCYRLHQVCTFSRRRGKRGPKPRTLQLTTITAPKNEDGSSRAKLSHSHGLPVVVSIQPSKDTGNKYPEQTTLEALCREALLTHPPTFTSFSICTFFALGPRLSMDLYGIIRSRIAEAPTLLLAPYGAVSRVFLRYKAKQPPCSDREWSSCASALEALRNTSLTKSEDLGRFLSLALGLVTFHRLVSSVSASTVCRFTLSLIRPFYYSGQLSDLDMMELTCLIFLDTTQSLIRARVPVIEYKVRDPFRVDQHAGLCGPLLPLLHQLCVLSAAIKCSGGKSTPSSCFDNLKQGLDGWSPNISSCTLERYSEKEVLLLLTQANLQHRAAGLLLHRLQHPFGEEDKDAEDISRSIIDDLQHCLAAADQLPPHITHVILIAGAEIHDGPGRQGLLSLISSMLGSDFYPFIANLRLVLRRVWSARDQKKTRYLFELFEDDLELSIAL